MVELINDPDRQLDLIFHALSDSTRRQILGQLRESPQPVTQLASNYDMSLNAVSKHIKVLEGAGLIQRTVKGRVHLCTADASKLKAAENWISTYREFWNQRLDALEEFVKKKRAKKR